MSDRGRTDIYNIEDECFDGTLLEERPGFRSLEREGLALTRHHLWLAGPVEFVEFAPNPFLAGLGSRGKVRLASNADWVTLAHELGHAASDGRGHGEGFCAAYVAVVGLLYGAHYGHRLEKAFRDHGKLVRSGPLVHDIAAIFDIDRLAGATRGGWKR